MKNKILFFSSRNMLGLYNFIIPVALKHLEKIYKKKGLLIYPKKYTPKIKYLIFVLKIILDGSFFNNKKFVNLRYNKFLIGRHVLAHTMRYAGHYNSQILINLKKLKYILIVDKILQNIENFPEEAKAAYIDHGMYLNGIYFQGLQKKKIIIYTNNYPKGFCFFDFRKSKGKIIQYSNLMALNSKHITQKKTFEVKKKLKLVLEDTTNIKWMNKSKFRKLKNLKELKKTTHLIYAHSFLEALYMYGYDGFVSYEEWLEFTIENLINSNNFIVVKGHPNFYLKDKTYVSKYDNLIFNKIKKKYSNFKNVIFINYSLKNNDLLEILNKKTIIVTRHSTALIESFYLNFKIITSSENFWNTNKLQFCETWKNSFEYKKLLLKSWNELRNRNIKDFYAVAYDLYCRKSFNLGPNYFINLISKHYNTPVNKLENLTDTKINNKKKLKEVQKLILQKSIFKEKYLKNYV